MPANLSPLDSANLCETSSCPSASTLTQNWPISRSRGQVRDAREGAKATSGGSRESELKDWQVNPIGPSSVIAVITVTPEAKWPRTSRITRGSTIGGAPSGAEEDIS